MLIDAATRATALDEVIAESKRIEAGPYDGLWMAETGHDPFLPLLLAAEHTDRVSIGTSIAVAFARTPMTLAYTAHDLQLYAKGRFILGLGSQIKPHIERRFSMPWSRPAARMREMISAIRAIWASWNDGTKLAFRGDFYTHTLMTPFFSPGPNPYGTPKVYLAAVGEAMTKVAGEVTDGLIVHPFTTERYLREVTLPTLDAAATGAGRTRADLDVHLSGFVASAAAEEGMASAIEGVRQQIAFYGSTPAYRGVFELHGWGGLGDELNALSRSDDADKWTKMGGLIDDEVLQTLAVVAEPDRMADAITARFGDAVDRFSFYTPYTTSDDLWTPVATALRA